MLTHQKITDAQLRVFLEIAKDESLTRAAERLNVSQPALSQQLHSLEEAVAQRLMERTGRGLRLTEAGKKLEQMLAGVFHYIDVSIARLRDEVGQTSGTITIAGVHNLNLYFLPTILKGFSVDYPGAFLNVLGRASTDVAKLVVESRCDIGLMYGTHATDERLAVLHLYHEEMVVGCAKSLDVGDHVRATGELPRPTPVVVFPRTCAVRTMIERAFPPGQIEVKAEVEALDTLLSLAGTGLGVCIVPAGVPPHLLAAHGLERLTLRRPRLMRDATLVFRSGVEHPPLVNALVQQIRSAARVIERQRSDAHSGQVNASIAMT
jgi:DNA-binding transcriptional LysR family regulator